MSSLIAALALLLIPAIGSAQPEEARERAAEHDKRGKAAFVQGDYEACIREYKKANIELPSERFIYNIAKCSEKAKRYVDAIDYYNKYLEMAPDASDREDVEILIRVLEEKEREQRGVRLASITSKPDANVKIKKQDGTWAPLGRTPLEVEVPAGEAELLFEEPGYLPEQVTAAIEESGQNVVAMLEPEPITPNVPGVAVDEPTPPPEDGADLALWSYITGGVGVAIVGGAIATGVLANKRARDANELVPQEHQRSEHRDLVDSSDAFATTSTAMFIAGGAAVATGVTLVIVDAVNGSEDEEAPAAALQVVPAVGPDGAFATARLRF